MQDLLRKYSELIGSIYDCVLDPSRWPATIGAIAGELSFANAMLTVHALPSGSARLVATSGTPDEWIARIPDYSADAVQLWGGAEHMARFPLDEPLVQSHQTPRSSWGRFRWYREFGVPQGIFDVVAIAVAREPTMIAGLGFGRAESAGEVSETELAPLRLMGPHLRRAITISKMLDLKSVAADTFASTIDALSVGVVLVDANMRVVHINPAALEHARPGGPLDARGDKVAVPGAAANAALEAAVRLAAAEESALAHKGLGIPIRDAADTAFVVHVLPLGRREVRPRLTAAAVAALFVTPAAAPSQFPADALALLYDLTPAETRVLISIADGMSQTDIAKGLGVRPSTVKTHLLHVLDKTGCHRQADLVRLVNSLSAPV